MTIASSSRCRICSAASRVFFHLLAGEFADLTSDLSHLSPQLAGLASGIAPLGSRFPARLAKRLLEFADFPLQIAQLLHGGAAGAQIPHFVLELLQLGGEIGDFHADVGHLLLDLFTHLFAEGFLFLLELVLLPGDIVFLRPQFPGTIDRGRVANDVGFFVALEPDEVAWDFVAERFRVLHILSGARHHPRLRARRDDYEARAPGPIGSPVPIAPVRRWRGRCGWRHWNLRLGRHWRNLLQRRQRHNIRRRVSCPWLAQIVRQIWKRRSRRQRSRLRLGACARIGRGRELRRRRRRKSRDLLRLQAEKGGMQGRGQRHNRRRTDDQPYRESLRQPVRHRIPPRKNSLDPFFRLSRFGHRDTGPPHTFWRRFKLRKKAEQRFGVARAIGAARQRGLVACLLREVRQIAFEPPRQRAEPEDRAVNQRQALPEGVVPLDVRKLVSQYGCEFLVVPFVPTGGEQNHRFAHAHHQRHQKHLGFS